jgi:HK97 family phage major capsid protein
MKTTDLFKKRANLIEQRDALSKELNELLGSEQLTAEQEARGSELMDKLEPLKRDIEEMQKHIGASQLRERFASYAAVEKATQENEKRSTEWTASGEYREQFIDWCRGGRAPETRGLAEFRDITTSSSSGVLVPKIYEAGILKYLDRNTVVRNLADLRTGVKGSVTLRRNNLETDAAVTTFWTTEANKTQTAYDAAHAEINLNPVGGLPKSELTQWVVRQSDFDIEAEVISHLQKMIARGIESGYTVGSGSNQPTGLFYNDSDYKAVAVSAAHGSGTGWDGAFTVDRLTQLRYQQLPAEYWSSAVWVMSQDAYFRIASLKVDTSASNVPLFIPSSDAGIMDQAPMMLMGRPVYIAPYAPGRQTAAVTNSIPLMFANVGEAFAIREWGGISMFRDDVTTPGLVKFQGMVFVNSKVVRPKAVAALRITLT